MGMQERGEMDSVILVHESSASFFKNEARYGDEGGAENRLKKWYLAKILTKLFLEVIQQN